MTTLSRGLPIGLDDLHVRPGKPSRHARARKVNLNRSIGRLGIDLHDLATNSARQIAGERPSGTGLETIGEVLPVAKDNGATSGDLRATHVRLFLLFFNHSTQIHRFKTILLQGKSNVFLCEYPQVPLRLR